MFVGNDTFGVLDVRWGGVGQCGEDLQSGEEVLVKFANMWGFLLLTWVKPFTGFTMV